MKNNTSKNKKSSIIWLGVVACIAVGLLVFCQLYFGDNKTTSQDKFADRTYINGVDVSGLTTSEAEDEITKKALVDKENINITIKSDNKSWQITGDDLEVSSNISIPLNSIALSRSSRPNPQSNDKMTPVSDISAEDIYCGIDQKVAEIKSEIESSTPSQNIAFNPNADQMFSVIGNGELKIVDEALLKKQISQAVAGTIQPIIEVPTKIIYPENDLNDFVSRISLRGKFSTDFSKSARDRKENISLALSKFNGMIVESGEKISFNATTGVRNEENGYKTAKIIVAGQYVPGLGGGVCQASTTLYNALLLSDIDVLQVCHHTLPASYVPLSFDAMVSEGYADLVFQNNLDTPIFIKSYTTDNNAVVEVYGEPLEEGLTISTKAELIKVIPHGGDDIIADTKGEYEDKVLYKGEYYRLKYPIEGYESKGFVQYYKNGELIQEKQIRNDRYLPQNGVIVEGTFSLEEGMTLPSSSVKYIPPQKITQNTIDNAKARWNLK
ncbi:MAG: hypothetical protein E7379_01045 [Clostridiales bacterium]|nr:hypothetical protein [Clostridiales bacterium]